MKRRCEASRGRTFGLGGLARPMLAALLLVGCVRPSSPDAEQQQDQEAPPNPVVVRTVRSGAIAASFTASSTIEAEVMVTVHAESTGRITSLSFEEGDVVVRGRTLARIRADVQASGIDRAATNLDKARRDLDVLESLYAKRVASREELDAARTAFENAKLDLRDRRQDMRNTQVTAPVGGTITERFVTEGAFVNAGQQLLTLVDFSTLVARVYVPEKEIDRIFVGQRATVTGKAARGREADGVVQRIAPVVDAATGTLKVTVALPEVDPSSGAGFLPGMYAEVSLLTEARESVTLLPKQAILRDHDQTFVFVVRDEEAQRVVVELGVEERDVVEVRTGVVVGDEVVVSGHAGLKGGAKVLRVDEAGRPLEDESADEALGMANTDVAAGGA